MRIDKLMMKYAVIKDYLTDLEAKRNPELRKELDKKFERIKTYLEKEGHCKLCRVVK